MGTARCLLYDYTYGYPHSCLYSAGNIGPCSRNTGENQHIKNQLSSERNVKACSQQWFICVVGTWKYASDQENNQCFSSIWYIVFSVLSLCTLLMGKLWSGRPSLPSYKSSCFCCKKK